MRFSVIIPIYNAAKTLERCLNCFVHQTFTDFELILVNDGSTDASLDICHRYADQQPFIRLVNQSNGGVSSARNAGIEIAQGDFLTFADADDEVTPQFLEHFDEHCNDCDLLMQGMTQIEPNGKARTETLKDATCTTAEHMTLLLFSLHDPDIPISACTSCFRHDLINKHHLRFDEQIAVCEDVDFVMRYMHHCHTVRTTEKVGYSYYAPANTKTYGEKNALRTSLRMIEDGFQLTQNETLRRGFQQRYTPWCTAELFQQHPTAESNELAARFGTLCLPYLRNSKPRSLPIRLFTMLCFNPKPQTILRAAKVSQAIYKTLKTTLKVATPLLREWPFMLIFMLQMGLKNVIWEVAKTGHGLTENCDAVPLTSVWGWVSIWFTMAYILAAIIVMSRRWYVKAAFYLITFVLFLVQHFLMRNFGMRIGPQCIQLMAETTGREATDFLNQNIFTTSILPTLMTPIFYILLAAGLETLWSRHLTSCPSPLAPSETPSKAPSKTLSKTLSRVLLTIFTLVMFISGIHAIHFYRDIHREPSPDKIFLMPYPEDPLSSIYASLASIKAMEACIDHAVQITKDAHAAQQKATSAEDSLNIILVIGESYIKWHAQIYGYNLQTTPHLKQEQDSGRLFIFNNVLTPSNLTTEVMKDLLCCNNQSEGEAWYDYPYLPAIFKAAGYDVYFWDNQLNFEPVATFSFTLNNFLYNPDIRSLSYTQTNTTSSDLDEDIVQSYIGARGKGQGAGSKEQGAREDLQTNEQDIPLAPRPSPLAPTNSSLQLSIFHLIGQHHGADAHYPAETFSHFTADSIHRTADYLDPTKKEYIAAYDNATLYNDHVLHQIMQLFNQQQSILIYLSDHGEEVYDYRDQCHRDQEPITPEKLKYQYEIPFVIWCSDSYREAHPETVEAIRQATDRPFMSDNLCHLLFHLGGIQTPFYKAQYDLISPQYSANKRMIKGQCY